MRQKLNSLERCLLAAKLESAFWASSIQNSNDEFLSELNDLESDVITCRFPYRNVPCSANAGRVNAPDTVL